VDSSLPTVLAWQVMLSPPSVSLSVSPSVHLLPLYLLIQLSFDLDILHVRVTIIAHLESKVMVKGKNLVGATPNEDNSSSMMNLAYVINSVVIISGHRPTGTPTCLVSHSIRYAQNQLEIFG